VNDDKADLREELDLSNAQWQRPLPEGADPEQFPDAVEIAFVEHVDGERYVAMRQAGTTLVFTPSEWDAFVKGAKDGEFDEPW
jgi:hypothetical protein